MFHSDKSPLVQQKERLRSELKEQRTSLSAEEYDILSVRLCEHLWLHPDFIKAKTVLFYVPHNNEPNIAPVIQRCLGEKTICFPRVSGDQLHVYTVDSLADLSPGAFGILEPPATQKINPKNIDLVLVPALGIDETGNRIGFGGGFYDRFLAQNPLKTLAVVFQFQRIAFVPTEEFDIPIDSVLSEWGVAKF